MKGRDASRVGKSFAQLLSQPGFGVVERSSVTSAADTHVLQIGVTLRTNRSSARVLSLVLTHIASMSNVIYHNSISLKVSWAELTCTKRPLECGALHRGTTVLQ